MLLGHADSFDGGVDTHTHVGCGLFVLAALCLIAALLRFG